MLTRKLPKRVKGITTKVALRRETAAFNAGYDVGYEAGKGPEPWAEIEVNEYYRRTRGSR